MGVPNLRAIRDWCKESFLSKKEILDSKDSIESNNAPGKLADALVIKEVFQSVSNGKELIASAITDKGIEADAKDTFAEMADKIAQIDSSGESGGTGEISSPYSYVFKATGALFTPYTTNVYYYLPVMNLSLKKLIVKSLSLQCKKQISNANSATLVLSIRGKKKGETEISTVKYYSVTASSTSYTSKRASDEEIDVTEYESIEYVEIYDSMTRSGTNYGYQYNVNIELELYS